MEKQKTETPVKKRVSKKHRKIENPNKARLAKMVANQAIIPKNYQMYDNYVLGDYILHNLFGRGIVDGLLGSDKMIILFTTGAKTLVHSRKQVSTL